MIQKKAARAGLWFCVAMLPAVVYPQAARPNAAVQPAGAAHPSAARPQISQPETPNPAGQCADGSCDLQPQHISIATPAPAPAPWTWQQRVAWAANLVLAALGYAAILMALALLRKIERQTRYAEETAQAAAQTAHAALTYAQAITRAERPWILMSVRPSQTIENGFSVVATNRGRGPARVLRMVDEVIIAVDEERLPAAPVYRKEPVAPADPMILLPGESTEIAAFSRADVQRVAESREQLERIEKWEEKIFLYGNLQYRNLTAPEDAEAHESSWLCWYIHGRQKSGMVMAGPPAYNRHT
ncbi:MAG TPA: hypothetical protein VKU93_06470 [Terracidiphilus sp.]|nr:hypothetical protein [Terracidiphilus sp.]